MIMVCRRCRFANLGNLGVRKRVCLREINELGIDFSAGPPKSGDFVRPRLVFKPAAGTNGNGGDEKWYDDKNDKKRSEKRVCARLLLAGKLLKWHKIKPEPINAITNFSFSL